MHCIRLDKELIRFPWLQEDGCENFACSFSKSPGDQNPDMGPVAGHQQSYAPVRESRRLPGFLQLQGYAFISRGSFPAHTSL